MESICKQFDCKKCHLFNKCGGCIKKCGMPFNGKCIVSSTIKENGINGFIEFKRKTIEIINNLGIKDLKAKDLNLLSSSYVNLECELENGLKIKLFKDNDIYLG